MFLAKTRPDKTIFSTLTNRTIDFYWSKEFIKNIDAESAVFTLSCFFLISFHCDVVVCDNISLGEYPMSFCVLAFLYVFVFVLVFAVFYVVTYSFSGQNWFSTASHQVTSYRPQRTSGQWSLPTSFKLNFFLSSYPSSRQGMIWEKG